MAVAPTSVAATSPDPTAERAGTSRLLWLKRQLLQRRAEGPPGEYRELDPTLTRSEVRPGPLPGGE